MKHVGGTVSHILSSTHEDILAETSRMPVSPISLVATGSLNVLQQVVRIFWMHVGLLCTQDYLKSQRLVFSLCCSQLPLLLPELLLCFLAGAPQTLHVLSRAYSVLTVLQKGFLQKDSPFTCRTPPF